MAPLCGHIFFAASILLCDIWYTSGISNEVLELLLMTSTVGLVITYITFGLVGLPTAYALYRWSRLNLWTMCVAGLVWFSILIIVLKMTAGFQLAELASLNELTSLLTVVAVFAPYVLMIATVFYWVVAKPEKGHFGLGSLLVLVSLFAASLAVASNVRASMQPRVVACVRHPNGSRLLVTQEWQGEPFDTSIFFDQGDGNWRWYYYEHEDWYWGTATGKISGDEIHVSAWKRSVIINTVTGECRRVRTDGKDWVTDRSTRTDRTPRVSVEAIERVMIST